MHRLKDVSIQKLSERYSENHPIMTKAVFILYTACWVLLNATTMLSVFWGFFLHTVHNVSVALEKHRVKQYYVQSLYDGPVKC